MRSHLLVVLLLGLLAACGSTPDAPRPEPTLEADAVDDFAKVRPPRVLVRPVESQTDTPSDVLRASFYRALIARRYAPYRLDLDPAEVPAGPTVGALVVRIGQWDRARAFEDGVIVVGGNVRLLVEGRTIWESSFANLPVRCHVAENSSPKRRDAQAARALASRILRSLPIKSD
jgi:hypothetical protein